MIREWLTQPMLEFFASFRQSDKTLPPNSLHTWEALFWELDMDWELHGSVFVWKIDSAAGHPQEVYRISPTWVTQDTQTGDYMIRQPESHAGLGYLVGVMLKSMDLLSSRKIVSDMPTIVEDKK